MRARALPLLVADRAAGGSLARLQIEVSEMNALVGRVQLRREGDFAGSDFRRHVIAPPMRQRAERGRTGGNSPGAVVWPDAAVVAEGERHAGNRQRQLGLPLVGD